MDTVHAAVPTRKRYYDPIYRDPIYRARRKRKNWKRCSEKRLMDADREAQFSAEFSYETAPLPFPLFARQD
jgi:hypothetical protein